MQHHSNCVIISNDNDDKTNEEMEIQSFFEDFICYLEICAKMNFIIEKSAMEQMKKFIDHINVSEFSSNVNQTDMSNCGNQINIGCEDLNNNHANNTENQKQNDWWAKQNTSHLFH